MNEAKSNPATFVPRLILHSSVKAQITAPTSAIDITDWLYNVDEAEYIQCTPRSGAHLSAGFTHDPTGKRMSINVEDIGGALIIEHYVEDISEKLHCRVASVSDVIIGREFTTAHATWELIVKPLGGDRHEFTNNCWLRTTEKYEAYLKAHAIPFEVAQATMRAAVDAHNAEEAPNFAAAIERKALSRSASRR